MKKYKLNIESIYSKIEKKIKAQCMRHGDKIVYTTQNDIYVEDMGDTDIYWWTNGFWAGILWQMYYASKDESMKKAAEGIEAKLDEALAGFEGLHHDVGFMWLHTAVANYRLTGDKKSRARGLHAATILSGRYNPIGKYIRAWNDNKPGWMIVDCLMNIPILYWAGQELNDSRFKAIATAHADTAINYLVREDGSCNHIAIINPENGAFLEAPGGQGYAEGSAWSRGQAWALYGFALSYRYTGEKRFLDAAKRVANYFISNIVETDYIPLADFRAPEKPEIYDTTAGTCAACGLLEIAEHVKEYEKQMYENAAVNIIYSTDKKHCDWDVDTDGIVTLGKTAYHDVGYEKIIYGDYFLIEAVLRMRKNSLLIW